MSAFSRASPDWVGRVVQGQSPNQCSHMFQRKFVVRLLSHAFTQQLADGGGTASPRQWRRARTKFTSRECNSVLSVFPWSPPYSRHARASPARVKVSRQHALSGVGHDATGLPSLTHDQSVSFPLAVPRRAISCSRQSLGPAFKYSRLLRSKQPHDHGAMSQNLITLYDVPSTSPQPWAPNIWRIRFILNFKRLPYRTVWVELADVENTLRNIGAQPSSVKPDGRPVFALPVIVDPRQGQPVVLSKVDAIAEYLELTYPARPIFPEGSRAVQSLFVHYIHDVLAKPLLPILVPLSHQRLPERSQAHFSAGQASLAGPERELAWRAARDQFSFLAAIMDKNVGDPNCDGVVVMGRAVSYADFALCAVLIWIEQVSPRDGWARVRTWDNGRWDRLRSKCREYMDVY